MSITAYVVLREMLQVLYVFSLAVSDRSCREAAAAREGIAIQTARPQIRTPLCQVPPYGGKHILELRP